VRSSAPSSAPQAVDSTALRVLVTHPFHPLAGQEFEFVKRRKNWQADRVYFVDGDGELATLPAEWTDVVPVDPFVVVAAGRAAFRTSDLLAVTELLARLRTVQR
jgi:Family of unknown function (DUF5372)